MAWTFYDSAGNIKTVGEAGPPGSAALTVQDEGTPLATAADTLDFVGAGVVATGAGTTKTITIAGGAGLADQGTFTYLDATEAAAPATPAAGKARIYAKTDGRFYSKDDAGVEYGPFDVGGGGGGSGYIAAITAESGITAYWPLNEEGTTYADAIGTADMTALATTPGFCASLTKDTAGGSLHIPSATFRIGRAALTWGASFTIEGWIIKGSDFVFGQWNGAGSMLFSAGQTIQAYAGASNISFVATAVETTGRHHVALTHDGTNLRLYWDGVLKAGPTALAIPGTNVGGGWRVGSYSDTTGNGTSVYGDIAFYSGRVLTASELLAHYNLGA